MIDLLIQYLQSFGPIDTAENDKGNPVIYYFSKETQFCTILNSFNTDTVAEEDILAACDLEISAVSRERLDSLYTRIPWFNGLIDRITQQGVATRISMNDIASYLSITPQSLSRIRRKG